MAEPDQEDEQGLREAVLDQRVFRICGDESTHGEAVSSCLGLFGWFLSAIGEWRQHLAISAAFSYHKVRKLGNNT